MWMEKENLEEAKYKFAWDMFVSLRENRENVIFSPVCVLGLFAPLLAGSQGVTARQLSLTLHVNAPLKSSYEKQITMTHYLEQGRDSCRTLSCLFNSKPEESQKISLKVHYRLGEMLLSLKEINYPGLTSHGNIYCILRMFVPDNVVSKIDPTFWSFVRDVYGMHINGIDTRWSKQTNKLINQLFECESNGTLTNLVTENIFHSETNMILLGALSVKAEWIERFDSYETRKAMFYTTANQTQLVDMMHIHSSFSYAHHEDLSCGLLSLPLTGARLSFLILLPDEMGKLNQLESHIKINDLLKLKSRLQKEVLQVKLPKFRLEDNLNLCEVMKSLGVVKAFMPENREFGGICQTESVYLSHVIHKTNMEINENGLLMSNESLPQIDHHKKTVVSASHQFRLKKSIHFNVNHPFLCFLWDEMQNTILLMARIRRACRAH